MKKLLVFVALACLLAVAPTALFEQAEALEEMAIMNIMPKRE